MKRAWIVAALLACAVAWADAAPKVRVRARLDPPRPVVVGQAVRLVVDVLVTTWLTAQPELPPLDVPGAVVAPSGESALNLTQQIDGATWFGVSLAYLVTPTAGGELAIPPIDLTLSVGQAAGPLQARTVPLTLTVTAPPRPPGAEHAIGTTRLELTQRLDRSLDGLRVGDAIRRTVQVSADGVRGMFLPPTAFPAVDGLAVYPAAPQVDDVVGDRVGFTGGRRVDAATYVVQRPGTYELPPVSVTWWDTAAARLRTASVPALTFRAAANPDLAPEIGLPADARHEARMARGVRIALGAGAAAVVVAAVWLLAPMARRAARALAARRAERRRRYEGSERGAFDRLRDVARADDAARTYAALERWVERLEPIQPPRTIRGLCAAAGDAGLSAKIDALEARLYGAAGSTPTWSSGELTQDLARARRRLGVDVDAAARADDLGPLNPA